MDAGNFSIDDGYTGKKIMRGGRPYERMGTPAQAERYKASYPPGTRITLLSMGNDPCPVESNTRGTVEAVDDIGTLHCSFDNGRSLGIVPGEDSFRKLTDEELAEEQPEEQAGEDEDMGEGSAPTMGM